MKSSLDNVFVFSPNRQTLGGTAYLIVEKAGNILVDCPAWTSKNEQHIRQKGGVRWLFITHRGGISKNVCAIQSTLNCDVLIQEQEAYLLPNLSPITFCREYRFGEECSALWTPGHSPGSSCLHWNAQGGILFSGRHLLPNQKGQLLPLRTAKTFHWLRQLDNVAKLQHYFTKETLSYLFPGANTGFLRGKTVINDAFEQISTLNLDSLRQVTS